MRKSTLLVISAIVSFFATSHSLTAAASKKFFIIQSGFAGCGQTIDFDPKESEIMKSVTSILARLKFAGIDYEYSISCFPFNLTPDTIRYYLPSSPKQLRVTSMEEYMYRVEKEATKSDADEVIVIGHSHGGWLAMYELLRKKYENKKIRLYTLDPISMKKCTPPTLVKNMFINTVPFGPKLKECTEFPGDLLYWHQKKLQKKTVSWINFYQTQFGYVHSAPAYSAKNQKVHLGGGAFSNQHVDIIKDFRVLNTIYKDITKEAP